MTLGFGPERERFHHSLFIILVNRLVACAVAAAALGLLGKSLQPAAPAALFAVPSVANVLGSASQYEALKYVSFPLQALAKCAKTVSTAAGSCCCALLMLCCCSCPHLCSCSGRAVGRTPVHVLPGCPVVPELAVWRNEPPQSPPHAPCLQVPVMAWGLLLGGRRYDRIDYGCAVTVTAGCALFVLTGSIAAPQLERSQQAAAGGGSIALDAGPLAVAAAGAAAAGGGTWMAYGLLLLGAFLLFDGLTSTTQDKLFAQYDMHSCNQLLWVSIWSAGMRCGVAGGRRAVHGAQGSMPCLLCAWWLLPCQRCCLPLLPLSCCCFCTVSFRTATRAVNSQSFLCAGPCSLAFLVVGGQLWPAVSFVLRHPSALVYILLLSAVSTAVQVGRQLALMGQREWQPTL